MQTYRLSAQHRRSRLSKIIVALLVWSMVFAGMPAAFAEGPEAPQTDGPVAHSYDFHKLGLDSAGTQPGWSIVAEESTPIYRAQSYGVQMNGAAKDDKITLQFDIAADGKYEIKFTSYLSAGGGIADVFIDGSRLAEYDFYAAAGKYSDLTTLGKLQLSAGTHKLTFKATGRKSGWGHDMYLSEIQFLPVMQNVTEYAFDFRKLGVDNQETQPGWAIIESETTIPGRNAQNYGVQVVNDQGSSGKITFGFEIPEEGIYEMRFKSYLAAGGGISDVLVNGTKIARYDFYDETGKYSDQTILRTVSLSAGTHKFTLQATGERRGWGHNMYPSELLLVKKEAMPELESVSLTAPKTLLIANETVQLKLSGKLSDRTDADLSAAIVSYRSSDASVAAVDGSGKVTAKQAGSAVITAAAKLGDTTKEAVLTVQVAEGILDRIELQVKSPIAVGRTETLAVRGFLTSGQEANLSGAEFTYTSSDPSVASFDAPGKVNGRKIGHADLRVEVTLAGVTKHAVVPVEVAQNALSEITVAIDKLELFVTQKANLTIQGKLLDGSAANLSQAEIVYTSGDPRIVTVDNSMAKLTAHAIGSTDITAAVTLDGTTVTKKLPVQVVEVTNRKTRATFYTTEKVAAARSNVRQFDWAKGLMASAVSAADKYVELGYDYLWNMVPPQTLPRSYAVNQEKGSPVSGKDINNYGNYPYLLDPINEPWKVIDPSAKDANGEYYRYPTNDFGAYYKSGLDENGTFRPEKADRALLVNELYPEKGPDWGVDDGFGWVDENGNRFTFIAYYTHWALWYGEQRPGNIQNALNSLRDAYIYTGDAKYAKAGTILLDRVADVYPQLDVSAYNSSVYLNSHGGTGRGKAVGSIWETFVVRDFVSAYDAFFPAMDDPEIIDFLQGKAEAFDLGPLKRTAAGIRRNIEDGIVRQVYPSIKSAHIRGNNGFHQSALAMAAIVYDTLPESKEWLDFNFQAGELVSTPDWQVTGGNMLASLVDAVDRDGNGDEAAPGYNSLWLENYQMAADILLGNDIYPEADLYKNVKFQKMYDGIFPLMLSDNYIAQIGDSGQTGNPGISLLSKESAVRAFEVYGDPVYAQLAFFLNNNHAEGIHSDVFTADPEQIADRISQAVSEYGPLKLESANLTGYGFTALRDGINPLTVFGKTYAFPSLTVTGEPTPYKLFASGVLQLEASAPGGSIRFAFDVPSTDEYEISLLPFRAASYGIYRISIDDEAVKELDFYGTISEHETIAVMQLAKGKHTITFEGIGKRAEATNYKMGVTELSLLDRKAVADRDAAQGKKKTLRDVWLYYGRSSGHGHRDTLNLGLHAFGLDLAPDLGYPEFADSKDMHRYQWVNNTVSHNTVVVDKSKQAAQWVGTPKHFDDSGLVKLIDVEAPGVYPQTSLYKRTTAMIQVDEENSYAVDFFRVKGGTDHHFSFHGPEGAATGEGLQLAAQQTGTYAGPDVEYGKRVDSVEGTGYAGSGFHYLKNVRKDASPAGQFSVDWDVTDTYKVLKEPADIHLKLTMLGQMNDVALADGVPPTNKPNNPASLTYLLAHRTGTNLESNFASVIEPYKGERFVKSISPLVVKANGVPVAGELEAKAVKVELTNGRTDYIVSAMNPDVTYTVDDAIEFRGIFGVYAEKDGEPVHGYVQEGTSIGRIGDAYVHQESAAVKGIVADFTKELSLQNDITVEMNVNAEEFAQLQGRFIYVQNDGIRNAAYPIRSVTPLGGSRYKLGIGDQTPVRSYADPNDFGKGFVYDIQAGAAFIIPLFAFRTAPALTEITGIQIGGLVSPMTAGTQAETVVSAEYSDGSMVDVTAFAEYRSSDTAVAAVSPAGKVTAISAGTTVITATYGGQDVGFTLTVKAQPITNVDTPVPIVSPVAEAESEIFMVKPEHVKAENEGRPVITLPDGKKELAIPAAVLELLTKTGLDFAKGEAVVSIPKEAIQHFLDRLDGEGSLSFLLDRLADTDAAELLDKTGEPGHVKLQAVGGMIDLRAGLTGKDGKQTAVTNLDTPITVKFKTASGVDPRLLGIYLIHDDGKLEYIGGTTNGDVMEAEITSLGKYALLEYDKRYADVDASFWAAETIRILSARHIVTGVTETDFDPQRSITRAEFAALLVRTLNLKQAGGLPSFSDVKEEQWFAKDVAAAWKAGLVEGRDNGMFAPDQTITREEMAVMLVRAWERMSGSMKEAAAAAPFGDLGEAGEWARESIAYAYEQQLLSGRADDRFAPKGVTSRAESAQAVFNLLKLLNKL